MIDYIWISMILCAVVYSIFNGTVSETVAAISGGAEKAVKLILVMMGNMAFWLGITEIAERGGITKFICKLLSPICKRLFKNYSNNNDVQEKISLNITSNLLGMSNAATPLGLEAMKSMDKGFKKPSPDVIMFVVINTTSLQIIPTQIAAMRSAYGSTNPFSIMPFIWICSLGSLIICLLLCKILEKMCGSENELHR